MMEARKSFRAFTLSAYLMSPKFRETPGPSSFKSVNDQVSLFGQPRDTIPMTLCVLYEIKWTINGPGSASFSQLQAQD
jgi:hypothetical protein